MRLGKIGKFTIIFCPICSLAFLFQLYVITGVSLVKSKGNTGMRDGRSSTSHSKLKHKEPELNEHTPVVVKIIPAVNTSVQEPVLNVSANYTKRETKNKTACALLKETIPRTDIQMLSLLKTADFKNGGLDIYTITYNNTQWSKKNKLKVFITPHSHNDPGWLYTFENYYKITTKSIINNMVKHLSIKSGRKFIWAEISFLSHWWNNDANSKQKVSFKKLLKMGQIEIVTGGWVMNDEANSHWLSVLQQLTTGHQWLIHALDYIPKNSWSIDPFGHSSSQPYLLKLAGIHNAVIQRVHYVIKNELAMLKQLEFNWRQLWDGIGKTDMFTHIMPCSYSISNTCGPDASTCDEFDFRKKGIGIVAEWKKQPEYIKTQSRLILEQWRMKADLFRSNVVMVPLGDDFFYENDYEWVNQYGNYELLMEYINSREEYNAEVRFGTLQDYFSALRSELSLKDFPVLSGDFLTYADNREHYWSGYYTTRPFYKRMDRVLLNYVRAAEIISAQAMMSKSVNSTVAIQLRDKVEAARQNLALFQHHDAITGTCLWRVMYDYANRMLTAIRHSQSAIQHAAYHLLKKPEILEQKHEDVYFNVDDIWMSHEVLPSRITIALDEISRTRRIVLYNSLTYRRQDVFSVIVSQPYVELLDANGKPVNIQVSPVVTGTTEFMFPLHEYQVTFLATVNPLALISYTIHLKDKKTYNPAHVKFATVRVNNTKLINVNLTDVFTVKDADVNNGKYMVRNGNGCRMVVGSNGLLSAVVTSSASILPLEVQMMSYGSTTNIGSGSGPYLFHPDGPGEVIEWQKAEVVILEGPILSTVYSLLLDTKIHTQFLVTTSLTNHPSLPHTEVEISNTILIESNAMRKDVEVSIRLQSDVQNRHNFYTDLNGMQMIKRETLKRLPLEGNYYPLPSAMYIEDKLHRLSILTSTPLGVAVDLSGYIDIMQDRKLYGNDNRGITEGVTDNVRTKHTFRLVFEQFKDLCERETDEEHPSGQLSLGAHISQQSLLHPLIAMHYTPAVGAPAPVRNGLTKPLGVDIILASYRSDLMGKITSNTKIQGFGMTFQRTFFDNCFENPVIAYFYKVGNGEINLTDITQLNEEVNTYESTLTHNRIKDQLRSSILTTCPMEIRSVFIQHTPDYSTK